MKYLKISMLFLVIIYFSNSFAAASTINLSSLGAYPTAQLGSEYDFKLGLRSNSSIKIAQSLIQISKSKSIDKFTRIILMLQVADKNGLNYNPLL